MVADRLIEMAQAVEQEGQPRAPSWVGEGVVEHEQRQHLAGAGRSHEGRIVPQAQVATKPEDDRRRLYSSNRRASMKASWGTSTRPMFFMRFLPSFCFSRSLRLRLMSPP
jgi:hypothetical protein